MLYHLSLNARDTDAVAAVLAKILGGTVLRSPSPPFDPASRFVCLWDDRGTMIEIGPWHVAFERGEGERSAIVERSEPTPATNYFHGLFLARMGIDDIIATATAAGWPAALFDNGPFRVVNVWVEGTQLLEFTTPELLPDYLATFGGANRDHLDGQLRALEKMIADAVPG